MPARTPSHPVARTTRHLALAAACGCVIAGCGDSSTAQIDRTWSRFAPAVDHEIAHIAPFHVDFILPDNGAELPDVLIKRVSTVPLRDLALPLLPKLLYVPPPAPWVSAARYVAPAECAALERTWNATSCADALQSRFPDRGSLLVTHLSDVHVTGTTATARAGSTVVRFARTLGEWRIASVG